MTVYMEDEIFTDEETLKAVREVLNNPELAPIAYISAEYGSKGSFEHTALNSTSRSRNDSADDIVITLTVKVPRYDRKNVAEILAAVNTKFEKRAELRARIAEEERLIKIDELEAELARLRKQGN